MKIIIADDHALTRSGLEGAINRIFLNPTVFSCEDAPAVIDCLLSNKHTIDLAIIDLYMPGSDGFQLLKQVVDDYPGLTVVVLSATENAK